MFSNIWLSVWSSDYATPVATSSNESEPANNTYKHTQEFYLGIYGALGLGQGMILNNLYLAYNKKSKSHLFQRGR